MRTFAMVLAGAALLGIVTGDRRFRIERAPFRCGWLFVVSAFVEVAPFLPPFRHFGFAGAMSRVCTVAGFSLLLACLALNFRTAGVAVMAVGVALNLAVIVANGGRMPLEPASADRAGISSSYYSSLGAPGPHRHSQAAPAGRLRVLDDRFPVVPRGQVISVGDIVLAAGSAWWLLAAMGSSLVPARRPEGTDVAASAAAG